MTTVRKTILTSLLCGLAVAISSTPIRSYAQAAPPTFKVSTGAEKGSTYTQMFRELNAACGNAMQEQNSSGSVQNLDRLSKNQVSGAIVQTDILYLRGRTDNMSNVKTLFALHPEELHFVALAQAKQGLLGRVGIGKATSIETVLDLAGKNLGAVGGSAVSARVVQLLGQIPFTVVEFTKADDAKAALAKGDIDAWLAVGGAPLASLDDLGAGYKLLSIPERVQSLLAAVYVPAKLSYSAMNSSGVPTVATEALFVVQDYRSSDRVRALTTLRACETQKIAEIREADGSHPKWKEVVPSNRGKWNWYDGK